MSADGRATMAKTALLMVGGEDGVGALALPFKNGGRGGTEQALRLLDNNCNLGDSWGVFPVYSMKMYLVFPTKKNKTSSLVATISLFDLTAADTSEDV